MRATYTSGQTPMMMRMMMMKVENKNHSLTLLSKTKTFPFHEKEGQNEAKRLFWKFWKKFSLSKSIRKNVRNQVVEIKSEPPSPNTVHPDLGCLLES